ncbi:glycosyltransferase family 4 protein [Mariniflexile gromovii]|uniref:Glycosyltransferase family 4 protein n=1 Tax=Mariniflexile gromovii TaxID=362523 RepID=A0ABS4BUI9_9FLAO|nr:glycosyltransferase family 4 protein [Mariniflexile gromovii]MBP0903717.1 glycosyltransferase family 4 protein [Mariniflexile gromovii]
MKIIISHPTSNQNSRAVVNGILNAQMLYEFHTGVATFQGDFFNKLSSVGPFKELCRRHFELELKPFTKTAPVMELGRLAASKFGIESLVKHETGLFSVDSVYQNLDKKVAKSLKKSSQNGLDAVYAYEDGAYYSFKEAKKQHIRCLYDLPIGYWRAARRLLENEIHMWPEWASTLTGFMDSESKLQRKDKELALADTIFVASSFTAKSLKDYPDTLAPIKVIPYGFPKAIKSRTYTMGNRPLKLLFVGGLSQRKGIANMFAAVDNLLPDVELTVIGRKSTEDCIPLNKALEKHHWIPSLSHDAVLEQMQAHDVLLFPSLFEGFGMVITEAMSQGTPVITTDRTVGPDLITHDVNGWLVEAGSTEDLQECIAALIKNPKKIEEVGNAALETAKQRPWHKYGDELAEAISKG